MSSAFEDTDHPLRAALLRAIDSIGGRTVSLRELMRLIGGQGMLLLCALLTLPFLLPVSIPGVSTVFGLAIILIAVGVTTNRTPWLPARIMDRPLDAEKLAGALRKGAGMIERIETIIKPRLQALTATGLAARINGMALIAGGVLLMFPLGLVPFSNTLPAFAVLFLCLGMTQRDGLLVLAGYGTLVATVIYFAVLGYLAFVAGQGLTSLLGG